MCGRFTLTNKDKIRFNPNLYRNGKVCISILNTWSGPQWSSCQSISSVLLTLITLFHNKPLLNEPGIKETHHSFKPYNKIITYRNVEHSIIKTFWTGMIENGGPVHLSWFFPFYKKYINNKSELDFLDDRLKTAIITPDKDIIPDANNLKPAYIVFDNYEVILKWNRSLRFALAVCTLKDKFKNEI